MPLPRIYAGTVPVATRTRAPTSRGSGMSLISAVSIACVGNACCQCNASKQDAVGVLDPYEEPFGHHLDVSGDGTICGLTPAGVMLIRICRLDRPKLTTFRCGMLQVWRTLEHRHGPEAAAMRQRFFGFPANLPSLA